MPVTQKIIAEHVGLSQSVVAEALGGHPRISESTRKRVRDVARRLGYDQHSNREARALIGRRYNHRTKSGIIAVLSLAAAGIYGEEVAAYFNPMMDGASRAAQEHDLALLVCPYPGDKLPRIVLDRAVDGIVILLTVHSDLRPQLLALDLPIVYAGASDWSGVSVLRPDEFLGGQLAARHLLQLGHRRIGFLGHFADDPMSEPRLAGLQSVLSEHGAALKPSDVEAALFAPAAEKVAEAVHRLLRREPALTAIFCHNDTIAMRATRSLRTIGVEVPRDISVIGFDDTSNCLGFEPAITSIHTSRLDIGRRAIELLAGTAEHLPASETFAVELVARESTCPPKG